jgi:hypothetical protein
MPRTTASDNRHSPAASPFEAPSAPPTGLAGLYAWVGHESFGRPVGPWAALLTPVPVGAGLLWMALIAAGPALAGWPWLAARLTEAAWLCAAPIVLATVGQAIAMAVSNRLWRESEGERHLDYSPRAWHYAVAAVLAALPLVALQLSGRALNAYLTIAWQWHVWLAPGQPVHVGYNPDPGNLLVIGVLPVVMWQVRRILARVPCGRLLGFQRELAKLKGAVAWDAKAWGEVVGETFERWMADIVPSQTAREEARRHRLRWMHLHREVIAAYQQPPADLARANRALATYRQGL